MHGGSPVDVGHVALLHQRVDDPMIRTFHPLFHSAAQVGQRVREHRATFSSAVQHVHPFEPIGAGGGSA